MDVSVIICTWNRAESLRRCLDSLTQLIIPEGLNWEVIVVNNRSTDNTGEVAESFQRILPLSLVWEPLLGHSTSRNTGILKSCGKLILFTDDDVIVHPNWLSEMAISSREHPSVGIFGGPIYPQFEEERGNLLKNLTESFFDGFLLRRNFGNKARFLEILESPFGANMAFRRRVFNCLKFDACLGLKGQNSIRGDETDLIERARQLGEVVLWVPEAKVNHVIPAKRISYSECGRYFWGIGRTHSLLEKPFFFPRLSSFTLFGFWAQLHFLLGYWFQFLEGGRTQRESF
jgi:glycosyltransferase involved in cell wall biosynthesis